VKREVIFTSLKEKKVDFHGKGGKLIDRRAKSREKSCAPGGKQLRGKEGEISPPMGRGHTGTFCYQDEEETY